MRSFKRDKIPLPKISLPELPNELTIEIGCGVGLHPIKYATANPEEPLLAIERTSEKFKHFQNRINHHPHLKNIYPLHADAISVITHLIKDNSVKKYFILYPNPYPKKNDQNKRFYAMPFMEEILRTLKPNGEIELATNDPNYRNECIEFFTQTWGLRLLNNSLYKNTPRTHFEKKYLERGEDCYNIIFKYQ